MFCREWLAQLELHKDEIAQAGLRLVAIGLGQPKHARHFCGKLAPSADCYTNNSTAVYKTYGLQQAGMNQLLNPGLLKSSVRAMFRGHRQGAATGDVKMLPGTFIVDREGIVQFAHYSNHPGDHPEIAQITRAAAKLTV